MIDKEKIERLRMEWRDHGAHASDCECAFGEDIFPQLLRTIETLLDRNEKLEKVAKTAEDEHKKRMGNDYNADCQLCTALAALRGDR